MCNKKKKKYLLQNNKMCKKTIRCAKDNNMYKKRKTVYWDLINSNVNKRDVQTDVQTDVQV